MSVYYPQRSLSCPLSNLCPDVSMFLNEFCSNYFTWIKKQILTLPGYGNINHGVDATRSIRESVRALLATDDVPAGITPNDVTIPDIIQPINSVSRIFNENRTIILYSCNINIHVLVSMYDEILCIDVLSSFPMCFSPVVLLLKGFSLRKVIIKVSVIVLGIK